MARAVASLLVVALGGCGGDPASEGVPECVELDLDVASCIPLFPATFDRIYEQVFAGADGQSECAAGGGACHGNADALGASHGMVFAADRDAVHASVLTFIEAGDPSCGPLSVRVHTDDPDIQMPPGSTQLDAGTRCAIAQWVEAGAQR